MMLVQPGIRWDTGCTAGGGGATRGRARTRRGYFRHDGGRAGSCAAYARPSRPYNAPRVWIYRAPWPNRSTDAEAVDVGGRGGMPTPAGRAGGCGQEQRRRRGPAHHRGAVRPTSSTPALGGRRRGSAASESGGRRRHRRNHPRSVRHRSRSAHAARNGAVRDATHGPIAYPVDPVRTRGRGGPRPCGHRRRHRHCADQAACPPHCRALSASAHPRSVVPTDGDRPRLPVSRRGRVFARDLDTADLPRWAGHGRARRHEAVHGRSRPDAPLAAPDAPVVAVPRASRHSPRTWQASIPRRRASGLANRGVTLKEIDLDACFLQAARLLYDGGLVAGNDTRR